MNPFTATDRRHRLFLSWGLLCYGITAILLVWKDRITSSANYANLGITLEFLAEHLWSAPAALFILPLLAALSWGYYKVRIRGKQAKCFNWLRHPSLPSFTRAMLLFLLFIFTIFPLRWAQRSFSRSPDSFPAAIPFDALLTLLYVMGTILCGLYCCDTLPLSLATRVEKMAARVFSWHERYFLGSLLILCLAITGTIAYAVLNHMPHVQDSIAQLFQAKIFRTGKLYASLPPHKEFFDYMYMINDTRWYSQYPPGHSLLLLAGLLLGAPWLVGPALGTVSLFLFYLFVRDIYQDRRMSYLATLLLLLSPFFLFMSSSHMNHTSTMFFILAFLHFYSRMSSSPGRVNGLISGVSLGCAIAIRPLTAVAVGAPFIFDLIISTCKKREPAVRKAFFFFTGLSLMVALLLFYNDLTTGSPLRFGYQQKHTILGFLGTAQEGPPHTLKGGVINTSNNLVGLNQYLFEWPVPSLIFVFILFLIPVKKNRWDFLFLCASLTLMAGYFFYYYQDYCFGPRFYYCLTPFLIVLTVRGLMQLPAWLEMKQFSRDRTVASLYLFLCSCFLWMLLFSLPPLVKKYSHDYWWVTDKIHRAVEAREITNAVVFIDCWETPDAAAPNLIYYGSGFQFNSPDLKDDVIYALDLKERNHELMKLFPERKYYFVPFFWDRSKSDW